MSTTRPASAAPTDHSHLATPSGTHERFAASAASLQESHAMLLLDEHGVVTDCSRGVAPVLGYEPAELVGRPVDVLFTRTPQADAFLARLRAVHGAEPLRGSSWMLRRDGLQMWAEVSCVAGVAAGGRTGRSCLTVRDATLQYRASQSVRSQADAAGPAALARNLFLGSIAHELRAALAPISTSALLLEREPPQAGRHEMLVGIIRRNAASAARLLEDLLTFSTASENKLRMRFEKGVDLHRLVSECTDAARQQALAAGLAIRCELRATDREATLACDPERIRQVLVNLIGNAIKFTPAGGSIVVRTACGPEGFSIEVADTGVGIDPSVLPFIFDPFEQGGSQVTSSYGGFGLGLAISSAIARQHGGNVAGSSAGRGCGATFRLCLPPGGVRSRAAGASHEGAGLHVLYVEDNPDAADAMAYALGTLGWTMTHAGTCARARELVHESAAEFDVILADLGLPDGSGLELGMELCRHLPVVALTAYGAPMAMKGFVNQLIKPAEISEVQRALLKAVAAHRGTSVA